MWFSIQDTMVAIFGYSLSYVEFVGTITGLLSVWLATRSNIFTWPTGLLNVTCFFLIFFEVRLYADMFLQVYFFVTSIYGWMVWHNKPAHSAIDILSYNNRIKLLATVVLSTLTIGLIVKNIHLLLPHVFSKPASYPFLDTFVAVLSVVATILLAQKKIENWCLWIIVDVISVALYVACMGLFTWVKLMRYEKRISIG
jgi:nicotinamide mononucleotide transporter